MMSQAKHAFLGAGLFLFASVAVAVPNAKTFSGAVTGPNGAPLPGAMVTLTDPARGIADTVYTDAQGRYRLSSDLSGKLELRVRHPAARDFTLKDPNPATNVKMEAFASNQEYSDSLPASAHFARMQWSKASVKTEFRSQCTYCHQVGNALTRRPRSIEEWTHVRERMEGMGALLTWEGRREIPRHLHENFNGRPLEMPVASKTPEEAGAAPGQPAISAGAALPEVAGAKIREWTLGEPISFMHDLAYLADGKILIADMSYDRLHELDPRTGKDAVTPFPGSSAQLGGLWAAAINPFGTFAAKYGPHALVEGPDGRIYIANALSSELTVFDRKSGAFKSYRVPGGVYPHTLRFDAKGRLWFTVAVSNQIARFDPRTEELKITRLRAHWVSSWLMSRLAYSTLEFAQRWPKTNLQLKLGLHNLTGSGSKVLDLPYGIDVNPRDGSVWYSQLYSDRIGRVDPETLEVEEFETPLKGPRRLRFDASGTLWIPAFMDNALMSFDPASKSFRTHPLPERAHGETESPYTVAVDPRTQEVWVTGNMGDRLLRYAPASGKWTAYPLPTRVTFMREIAFSPDQATVCSTYSNAPAHAIEGGRPKVVCLTP